MTNLKESDYTKMVKNHFNGISHCKLDCGLIPDVITAKYAIEVDYTHKWAESIGQSLLYAKVTNRKPLIVFIYDKLRDYKQLDLVLSLLRQLAIRVYVINKYDFSIEEVI